MSSWFDDLPPSPQLDALVERVENDEHILGVLLTGSWAHGMATEHSDVDVLLVRDRPDLSWERRTEELVDVAAISLDRLRDIPADPRRWWDRYTYARARVLLDRTDGYLQRVLDRWGTLTDDEAAATIDQHIDGYLTYLYRSLQDHREGRALAARLDACESLPWALPLVFAVHRRVRPANKYLAWELEHAPFDGDEWSGERILSLTTAILDGSPDAQRDLFALIEPATRRLGFGGVIDGFGPGLALLRNNRG